MVRELFYFFAILRQRLTIVQNGNLPVYLNPVQCVLIIWNLLQHVQYFGMHPCAYGKNRLRYSAERFPSLRRASDSVPGTTVDNTSRYSSLGPNLECVMSCVGKVAPCVGLADMDLFNLFINVQILSYSCVFLLLRTIALAFNNI